MTKEEPATKSDFNALENKLDKRFDDVVEIIQSFMGQVSNKFEDYDDEFRMLNKKYDPCSIRWTHSSPV